MNKMADILQTVWNTFRCTKIVDSNSMKFASKSRIVNKLDLVQVMDRHRICDEPLPEPLMTKMHNALWHH